MKRFGQIIKVKPEKLEYYKKLHANPWPEVVKQIKACNITNYSIFNYGDYLFAYFEYVGDDFESDMKKMADDPITQKWWRETDPCQEPVKRAKKNEMWVTMDELFYIK